MSGALDGYLLVMTAAIIAKHSVHSDISVMGTDRRGMRRTNRDELPSVVSVCHASCRSSDISINSRFSIL